MTKTVVVDYGIGNVFSVCQAIKEAGGDPLLTGDRLSITNADRVVLPGVGAFGRAAEEIRRRGHDDAIRTFAATGRPFLGLCVGMQVMFDSSSENGTHAGLGIIPGSVARIPNRSVDGRQLRIPHIGWAELIPIPGGGSDWAGSILRDTLPDRSAFYFVHSYSVHPTRVSDILAVAMHGGIEIVAAVKCENLSGAQFHPERSGAAGQKVIRQFLAS